VLIENMDTIILSETKSYLIFKLGSTLYGIEVAKVLNIIEMTKMTSHNANNLVIGYVNLRNSSIPVVDVRNKLGIEHKSFSNNSCVLLVETGNDFEKFTLGILIDALHEVSEIKKGEIDVNSNYSEFITGVSHRDKMLSIHLIEPNKLFSENELIDLKKLDE
jgi:purine-binding chemotaxis protein CheW